MKFISEEIIDRIAEEIGGSEEAFKEITVELSMEQPNIAAYIFSDNFDLFTDAEKQYFLFLVLVIFKSIKIGVSKQVFNTQNQKLQQDT